MRIETSLFTAPAASRHSFLASPTYALAEGYERGSDAEIARFLTIAKGSAGELRTQILIGIEANYLNRTQALQWADEAKQLGKILGALIKRHRSK